MDNQKLSIRDYQDYRAYIQDWMASQKKISLRKLAKDIGVSHSYFSMILSGKRNLSIRKAPSLGVLMGLNSEDQEYFECLILVSDSRNPKKRLNALKKIQEAPRYKENHPLEFEVYKYLEKWQYIAIRELVNSDSFRDDPKWIQKHIHFPLRTREVEEALEFLKKHKFIEQRDGKWVQAQKELRCVGGVYGISLQTFHENMLKLAGESMSRFRRQEREQSGYTFCISQGDFEKVQGAVQDTINKVRQIEQSSKNKDSVYHLNLSAFPLAGKKVGGVS